MQLIRPAGRLFSSSFSGGGPAASGGDPLYPNKPSAYMSSREIDFSQVPALSPPRDDQVDYAIPGATDWLMWGYQDKWSQDTDATAPQSPSAIWTGHWPAGSYGGGVINSGSGHGIGNVFSYGPNGDWANVANTPHVYLSMRCKFEMPDTSYWHPISNKFVNIEGNQYNILVQLNEGGNWLHATELSTPWAIVPGEVAGRVDNSPVPINQWVHIEVHLDIPNGIFRVWRDGVIRCDCTTAPFVNTGIHTVGVNAFRGGGGETLDADLYWHYDHFYIAW